MAEDFDKKYVGCCIHNGPDIFLIGVNGSETPLGAASLDLFLDRPEPLFLFFCPMWTMWDKKYRENFLSNLMTQRARYPQHRYTLLLNDPVDLIDLGEAARGLDCFIWNTNCTADPKIFSIGPDDNFNFDAVYIGRPSLYKRLELAAEVKRLCLISRALDDDRLKFVRDRLPDATIPNVRGDRYVNLGPSEVAAHLVQAQCGLMLSLLEGQNRSTMEYLLSGLPVVTTANRGGRDRFLHPDNSIIVRSDPAAIAKAVRMVPRLGFDRGRIRRGAIMAMRRELRLLVQIINDVLAGAGYRPLQLGALDIPHKASSNVNSLRYFMEKTDRAILMSR